MTENVLLAMLIIFIYIFLFLNQRNVIYIESNSGMKFLIHKDTMVKDKTELFSIMVENMLKLKNHLVKNKDNFLLDNLNVRSEESDEEDESDD